MTKYLNNILKWKTSDHYDVVYDIEKSHDVYLYDREHDRYLLDLMSFFASNPLGYNHPKLNIPEFEKSLLKVAKTNPTNGDFLTEEYSDFLDTFHNIAMPPEFKYRFFISGGTLAVENALKAAFDWKIRKLLDRNIFQNPDTLDVIHFKRSFHGRSGYSLSITKDNPLKYKFYPRFNWTEFDVSKPREQEDIESYINHNKNKVAAIIVEPIQSAGGDIHFNSYFLPFLRRLATQNDVMLILDEVQTGIGLTGKFWAYQHYGIVPDMVCFGKKLQVCGFMATDRLDEVKNHVFKESSRIDSTWNGNLTDMIRAKRYLEIIKEDGLVENANAVGKFLLSELSNLGSIKVSGTRGLGLMCAFDLPTKQIRDTFIKDALNKQNLLLFGCGEKTIRLRPSLIFSKENVIEFISRVKTLLTDL
jgi:L-lysine 6-transaminase